MISIGANGEKIAYGIKHYNVDTKADLAKLNTKTQVMGTTAFVIEESKYYMLNGSKIWKQIDPYGSGSFNPDESDEIIYEGGGVESDSDTSVEYEGGGTK